MKPLFDKNYSRKYALRLGFYIAMIALLLSTAIAVLGILKVLTGSVIDGDTGKPLDKLAIYSIVIPAGIIGVSWLWSLIVMLRQMFVVKYSFSVSQDGIHNLLVGGIFLAFVIIIPVRNIPWESLKIDKGSIVPRLTVETKALGNRSFIIRAFYWLKGLNLLHLYSKLDEEWYEKLMESNDDIQSR